MITGDKILRYMLFRSTLQSNPNIKRGLKVSGPVFQKYAPGVHNLRRQIARATNFCTTTLNNCGFSLYNLLQVTVLAPRRLK
jgi:hypothetical protein